MLRSDKELYDDGIRERCLQMAINAPGPTGFYLETITSAKHLFTFIKTGKTPSFPKTHRRKKAKK